jgi:hypothetical protein
LNQETERDNRKTRIGRENLLARSGRDGVIQ